MPSVQFDIASRVRVLRKRAARARALDAALPGRPDADALLGYAGELERQADDLEATAPEAAPPLDYAEDGRTDDLPAVFRAAEAADGIHFGRD